MNEALFFLALVCGFNLWFMMEVNSQVKDLIALCERLLEHSSMNAQDIDDINLQIKSILKDQ